MKTNTRTHGAGGISRLQIVAIAMLTGIGALACTETGPGTTSLSNVAVSFSTQPNGPAPAAGFRSSLASIASDTLVDGSGNSLILTSAEVVLRKIELKRVEVVDCDAVPEPEGCEDFEIGPVLIDLPLTPGVQRQVAVDLPSGIYKEVDFEVHKPSGGDAAFIQANPDFDGVSIRVRGSFNGSAFEFTSDLDVEQELALVPNLVITGTTGASTNLTIQVNVRTWFLDGTTLVDPTTANKGGANEGIVKENIKTSFKAFEDDDEDGNDD